MSSLQDNKLFIVVHEFGQSNKDYSALPPNWRDDLSWPLG